MVDKQLSLILVDKNKLWLYSGLTTEVFSLDFPTTVVKDMEVLNHELFIKQFESFLSVHNVTAMHVPIVLATSLLFIKDFSGIEEAKKDETIKGFVENVPFDSVSKITIHLDKVIRVVVANRDLIYLLKNSLEKHKCEVPFALPASIMPNTPLVNGLTAQIAQGVLGQIDAMHSYNLLDQIVPQNSTLQNITANAADKKHPKRLPLMLGLFGGLISILIGTIVVTNTNQPTIPNSQATAPQSAATPVIVQPTVAASESATIQTVRLDLLHSEQATPRAIQLTTALKNSGVIDLRDLIDNTPVGESSQINFSQTVPALLQDQIIAVVKTIDPAVSTKVVSGLARDIEIRLK